MLYQQRILTTDPRPSCNVRHFDKQCSIANIKWRNATINNALFRVYLRRAESHLVRVVVARFQDTTKDVSQLWFVIDQLQQGLTFGSLCAYTEDVFGGRIEACDQQARIEQDDARTQAVEDSSGILVKGSVVTGTVPLPGPAYRLTVLTVLCCT